MKPRLPITDDASEGKSNTSSANVAGAENGETSNAANANVEILIAPAELFIIHLLLLSELTFAFHAEK
jgi:hypothetical protein